MNRLVFRIISLILLLGLLGITFFSLRTLNRLPSITVYLVKTSATNFTLEPVTRLASSNKLEDQLATAVNALISGPTDDEKKQGLITTLDAGIQLLGLELSGSEVRVNLADAFQRGGGSALMLGRLNQVFYTLSQAEGVDQVSLLIEGEKLSSFSEQGLLIDNPWQRSSDSLPVW